MFVVYIDKLLNWLDGLYAIVLRNWLFYLLLITESVLLVAGIVALLAVLL